MAETDSEATVFESTTAAAFVAMSETPADLAIVEVGLGGVLDATNVIERPLLSVIAPVDYDHAEFLGTDLAAIASEKAGVLKAGAPAVIARQREEAMAAIERRAADVHARLTVLGVDFGRLGRAGRHGVPDRRTVHGPAGAGACGRAPDRQCGPGRGGGGRTGPARGGHRRRAEDRALARAAAADFGRSLWRGPRAPPTPNCGWTGDTSPCRTRPCRPSWPSVRRGRRVPLP